MSLLTEIRDLVYQQRFTEAIKLSKNTPDEQLSFRYIDQHYKKLKPSKPSRSHDMMGWGAGWNKYRGIPRRNHNNVSKGYSWFYMTGSTFTYQSGGDGVGDGYNSGFGWGQRIFWVKTKHGFVRK